jgi:HAD superfamily hydrolase (TIGR01484 family)
MRGPGRTQTRPVAPAPLTSARWRGVRAIFTDVDGTLTTRGVLLASTLAAMERLRAAGIRLVLVTGRPSGWGECWARMLPVDAVIAENGALCFAWTRRGLRKTYSQPSAARRINRPRLLRAVSRAMTAVPGARWSMDALATEVDIAVDYHEEARLDASSAERIEGLLRSSGVTAVRSSVHINCWIGRFDKLSAARRFVRREWGQAFAQAQARYLYVGDSLNDAPMFGGFSHSVGVANVRDVLDRIPSPPAYVTRAAEGKGFEELAAFVLEGRAR